MQQACKPGSVLLAYAKAVIIHLVLPLLTSSSTLPVLSHAGHTYLKIRTKNLFAFAPNGVYQTQYCCQFGGALLPHRFTITL